MAKAPRKGVTQAWTPPERTELVTALGLAVWWGAKRLQPQTKQPPPPRLPIKPPRPPSFNEARKAAARGRW